MASPCHLNIYATNPWSPIQNPNSKRERERGAHTKSWSGPNHHKPTKPHQPLSTSSLSSSLLPPFPPPTLLTDLHITRFLHLYPPPPSPFLIFLHHHFNPHPSQSQWKRKSLLSSLTMARVCARPVSPVTMPLELFSPPLSVVPVTMVS
jgi:hypothetical protein